MLRRFECSYLCFELLDVSLLAFSECALTTKFGMESVLQRPNSKRRGLALTLHDFAPCDGTVPGSCHRRQKQTRRQVPLGQALAWPRAQHRSVNSCGSAHSGADVPVVWEGSVSLAERLAAGCDCWQTAGSFRSSGNDRRHPDNRAHG